VVDLDLIKHPCRGQTRLAVLNKWSLKFRRKSSNHGKIEKESVHG